MQSVEGDSTDLGRWQQQPAAQAVVLEGEVVGQTPEGQIRLLKALLEALIATTPLTGGSSRDLAAALLRGRLHGSEQHRLAGQASTLLGRTLPYTEEDLRSMLELLVDGEIRSSISVPLLTRLVRHVERYAAANGLPSSLRPLLERERDELLPFAGANECGWLGLRVERLLAPDDAGLPEPSEPWAAAMRACLNSMDADAESRWRSLLAHGTVLDQTKPSAKWLRVARERIEPIGFAAYREQALAWLSAAAEPSNATLTERNGAILKGLAWSSTSYEDEELSRALARLAEALLRWLPTRLDWRGLRAGNACLNALAAMPGLEPLTQLSRLALWLKGKQLQRSVGRAIEAAIERRGLPREDLEELMVPTHGIDPDGVLRTEVGGVSVEIAITGKGKLEWQWIVDGSPQRPAPASVWGEHADELRVLRAAADELRRTLSAQRARLEQLFVSERTWRLREWRACYRDHPLLRQMTRSLIWQMHGPEPEAALGIPTGEGFTDEGGLPIADFDDDAEIRLWHPCEAEPGLVEAWRRRLVEIGVTQPFEQVQRELYCLTPQEWAAGASARFAGRILRQQQLNALCREHGWHYTVRGPWHGGQPRAIRPLPQCNVQAEFWLTFTRGSEVQLTRSGMYPCVSSDVLCFSTLDGGDCLLSEVPERVLSEILRDVDLFVSASELSTARPSTATASPATRRRSRKPKVTHRLPAATPQQLS